jgi:hypothetical protein
MLQHRAATSDSHLVLSVDPGTRVKECLPVGRLCLHCREVFAHHGHASSATTLMRRNTSPPARQCYCPWGRAAGNAAHLPSMHDPRSFNPHRHKELSLIHRHPMLAAMEMTKKYAVALRFAVFVTGTIVAPAVCPGDRDPRDRDLGDFAVRPLKAKDLLKRDLRGHLTLPGYRSSKEATLRERVRCCPVLKAVPASPASTNGYAIASAPAPPCPR